MVFLPVFMVTPVAFADARKKRCAVVNTAGVDRGNGAGFHERAPDAGQESAILASRGTRLKQNPTFCFKEDVISAA